ncbi:nucleotide pyrophosphohydrolase [Sulfurirhabdus autotrophica]|uniref:NTP pyrophosphatase (Non-canonical NTP hydrolase) n=1 Tax=Sulfurirhabdus autotrophica TaxID=1706046 RepID=A0A4R3Y994_9PROT|nr:nucleotide pyrophosphohydrolase [Sulfurirhabdus autotrophica]TCV88161.1 NTP pyrophosphatase (non-canonical NTP hydrolase) [Sulfurirhabdus autotrophica]
MMKGDSLKGLQGDIRAFAKARDWDQFHTPKNLSMALSVEVAELMEHFQWLSSQQSVMLDPPKLEAVSQEIGDVLIYLTRLADVLGIDPVDAAFRKMQLNEIKYPVEKSKGIAAKYTEL